MATEMVVKVGGSLYDLPQLGRCLQAWLDEQKPTRILVVAGGGAAADLVRQANALDGIGEERSHWLALRSLSFTAHLLAARLPGGVVIENLHDRHDVWKTGHTPILDMFSFTFADEARPDRLPHRWAVTSDSLAARAALVADIPELVLLKSCDVHDGDDWIEAAQRGFVDAAFPDVLAASGGALRVGVINFRRWHAVAANATVPQNPAP